MTELPLSGPRAPGWPCRAAFLLLPALLASSVAVADRSFPVDCLPDRIAVWDAAEPAPGSRFGAPFLPGVVLGPPGDSLAYQGSFAVASLGFGGRATVGFDDIVIEDGPGPDFIVFENAFFKLPLPTSAADDFFVFAEPGIVEVSSDGEQWHAFPYDDDALQLVGTQTSDGSIDKALYLQLTGLAGRTPTFTGNWTRPDDPVVFDPTGPGGVTGAGGDAFDLADVGLSEARFVRITDADTRAGFTGSAEGFDLDAIVALHARPLPPASPDGDGDGLSDLEETSFHSTDPIQADSDGDTVDDGREVAACRDPLGPTLDAHPPIEPRLWLSGRDCTEARWTFVGTGPVYDLIRGDLAELSGLAGSIDLGPTVCLVDDNLNVRWSCDGDEPLLGEAFTYLVRIDNQPDWGRASDFRPRGVSSPCP